MGEPVERPATEIDLTYENNYLVILGRKEPMCAK